MKLLDVRQVSKRLSVSTMTVYRMIRNGRLPHIIVGAKKGFRVNEDTLNRMILTENKD